MQKLLIYLICSATLILGCTTHRLEIQQGNVVTTDMVEQLKLGMTFRQVRFLLGTPLAENSFRPDRWDYIYTLVKRGVIEKKQLVTLHFDAEKLANIEHSEIVVDP